MSDALLTGPFTYQDAIHGGLDRRELDELVRAGEVVTPHRGIYLPTYIADDVSARVAAVALVLPPGAALARESAAWLMGIDVRPPTRWQAPPSLECLVPEHVARPAHPGINAFVSSLPPEDIFVVDGVPCTTPVRTAVDLARYRARHVGLGAIDAITHAGLASPAELRRRTEPLSGHRFIKRAREVIELCDPRTESPGESWTRLRLVEAGLPAPEVQISLRASDGREVYRLDMGYEKERVGIDYDGFEHHLRTPRQREHDDAREHDVLSRFRWRLARATSVDVLGPVARLEDTVMDMLGISLESRRRPWTD